MTQEIFALTDAAHSFVTDSIKLNECEVADANELLFCYFAARRGWKIYNPYGHAQSGDACISRRLGRPIIVQVKTAQKDRFGYVANVARGKASKTAYGVGEFDVLAYFLPDTFEFVFWTLGDLRGRKRLRYHPERHRQPSNWHLLDEVAAQLSQ